MTSENTPGGLAQYEEYPKLVRDKIPEIIEQSGGKAEFRTLEDEEFLEYLKKKAVEESKEVALSVSDQDLLEEIADLKEVLDARMKYKGFTVDQVEKSQEDKREKRGGFDLRILMLGNKKSPKG